jgi:ferredoxin
LQIIHIHGLASGKWIQLEVQSNDLKENLLFWLRKNNLTIASSCDGEGVCRKCTIQNDWATCEMTLKDFLERQPDGVIKVSYL